MIGRVILCWLVGVVSALANLPHPLCIASVANARGHLVKVVDAATNTVGKTYDGAGNLVYLTNRNAKLWTFQYDGANRLTNTISPLSHSSSQVYNNRGLLQSSTDPLTHTTTYGYDARGRMTNRADSVGTTLYQYDPDSNLTNASENGQSLQKQFDAYDRMTSYTDVNGFQIQYQRDADGNVTNLIYPGSLSVKYYYDSNNRLTNITDWSGRQTAYSYDLAGHLTGVTRPNNTLRTMAYDADGELTNIVEQTTSHFPIAFHTLNYNLAGRVQWEFKGPLPHTNTPPTRTMTFDNDNRLATFNSTSVTMDNNGNMTYGPGTNGTFLTYGYDARNRLTNAGGNSYGYDLANHRVSLTNGTNVAIYVIDPTSSQVLMRIQAGVTNYYIYGAGLAYEIDETATATTTAFYHFDCRGSTVALTDSNGNPTDMVEYSPYGTTTYRFGTNTTPFLYNGQFGVQTDVNGLLYMRARYYNPYVSRFLNPDPSGFGGGLNFYAFCNGNPISLTDPFGLGAEGQGGGYSWIGQINTIASGGAFPYYNGTGLGSDLVAATANLGSALDNGIATVGNTNHDESPFGNIIYTYTRAHALADGFQIDVSKTAQEAGIRFPVFLTRGVYNAYVTVPPGVEGQDEAGRLWDVLHMLRIAIHRTRPGLDRLPFALYVRNDNNRPQLVKLIAHCGRLDVGDPQPAITVLLPDED